MVKGEQRIPQSYVYVSSIRTSNRWGTKADQSGVFTLQLPVGEYRLHAVDRSLNSHDHGSKNLTIINGRDIKVRFPLNRVQLNYPEIRRRLKLR